jgi:predicted AAA+ superfamily ATPase
MFNRKIISDLKKWADKRNRKPLILRGARQTGKTSAVRMFSKKYEVYIELNLEKESERRYFEELSDVKDILDAICLTRGVQPIKGKTLLFIDEIQFSPRAVAMLRYFYEEMSWLHVISAGSLLDTIMDKKISFPVGRVEYLPMHPCSFSEFLMAIDHQQGVEVLSKFPFPEYAHIVMLDLFKTYAMIGGMPEVIATYKTENSLTSLSPVYDALITSYLDDVEKYARNSTLEKVIRHIIENSFRSAGTQITFQGFGNSLYRSREMSEAFKALERTFFLQLVYPVTSTEIPMTANLRRSPKLQVMDTGLVNYMAGNQVELMGSKQLSDAYNGKIAEHITGQELKALTNSVLFKLKYWARESKNATAELDFVWQHAGKVVPIEVKSGKSGKLRSLHQFMNQAGHPWAVRIYSGTFSVEKVKTVAGKEFWLMNLPFYLINQLPRYLDFLMGTYKN